MMYDHEKSDPAIVAVKPTNKAGQPAAELAEPRAGAEGNVSQQSTGRAQYRGAVSQALERIRQAARQRKKEKFTAVFHHVSIDALAEARDLRGRFPRVLVWVPTRTQHARCDGCAHGRDHQHKGELDTGRRHPLVLRHGEPGVAHQVCGTSRRRPTYHPPDPEMAQGRRPGRRDRDGQSHRVWPISTYTTFSTSGPSAGDGVRLRAI